MCTHGSPPHDRTFHVPPFLVAMSVSTASDAKIKNAKAVDLDRVDTRMAEAAGRLALLPTASRQMQPGVPWWFSPKVCTRDFGPKVDSVDAQRQVAP